MAHAQKPDFVFPRNGRVHLNRWGRQFSRLLAAELCASAWVMLDRPRSDVAWEYWLPTPFASFPFTSPPVRHRVPPGSERALRRVDWSGLTDVLKDRNGVIFMVRQSSSLNAVTLTRSNTHKTHESSQTHMKSRKSYNKVEVKPTLTSWWPYGLTRRSATRHCEVRISLRGCTYVSCVCCVSCR